jgi:hypothetical protein
MEIRLVTTKGYPILRPPNGVRMEDHAEWTKATARKYLLWFVDVIPQRLHVLEDYFQKSIGADTENNLVEFGKVAEEALMEAYFSDTQASRPTLTDAGYSLAADMGFLLSQSLLESAPSHLQWSIANGPKTYVSRRLPVVTGFGNSELDPILVSTNLSLGVIRGRKSGDAWLTSYRTWLSKIRQ